MKERDLERTLKALANKRRLDILKYLSIGEEANVGNIAKHIHLSFKSTSRHLGILASADLLDKDQRGLEIFYSISKEMPDIIKAIIRLI